MTNYEGDLEKENEALRIKLEKSLEDNNKLHVDLHHNNIKNRNMFTALSWIIADKVYNISKQSMEIRPTYIKSLPSYQKFSKAYRIMVRNIMENISNDAITMWESPSEEDFYEVVDKVYDELMEKYDTKFLSDPSSDVDEL